MILPLLWERGTRLSFQDQLPEPHFIASSSSVRRPPTTSVCESGCSTFCFLSPTKPSSPQLQLLQSPNICLSCLPRNSPMIWTSVFRTFRGICLALIKSHENLREETKIIHFIIDWKLMSIDLYIEPRSPMDQGLWEVSRSWGWSPCKWSYKYKRRPRAGNSCSDEVHNSCWKLWIQGGGRGWLR